VTDTLEHTARRIAEQGRDALVARLRPAFEEAAAAHKDALPLDQEQLEQMVQQAADKADGLQWRRALASVATEQLGIGLGEALGHPAVARAQAIVGAPSYEEALGALPAAPAGNSAPVEKEAAEDAAEEATEPAYRAHDEPEGEEAEEDEEWPEDEELDDEDEPEPTETHAPPTAEHVADEPEEEDEPLGSLHEETDGLRIRAVHLGGIANLAPAEGDLELHISSVGLDILRGPEHTALGRLTWDEIVALETPELGGRFRRKRAPDAHLVIRSRQGSASFEIPGVSRQELEEHLAPLLRAKR
jgi:hypothetical protein